MEPSPRFIYQRVTLELSYNLYGMVITPQGSVANGVVPTPKREQWQQSTDVRLDYVTIIHGYRHRILLMVEYLHY